MTLDLPHGAIVVGVDGHPHGMYAAAWAAHQADRENRPLVVVNAAARPAHREGHHAVGAVDMHLLAGQRHAERGMRRALEAAPRIRVETLVRAADPAHLLTELGETASMLVVGSRSLGPVASVVHGSVSLAVCASAACPVVVVREEAPRPPGIVVGSDGTEASAAAVEFGFAQASLRGVPLTVLHGVTFLDPWVDEVVSPEAAAPAWVSESVAGLREKYIDVDVRLQVANGPATIELVEASRHADLVVVGTRDHRGPVGLHLGSVSQAVIEQAHCSIAVIRPRVIDAARAGSPDRADHLEES